MFIFYGRKYFSCSILYVDDRCAFFDDSVTEIFKVFVGVNNFFYFFIFEKFTQIFFLNFKCRVMKIHFWLVEKLKMLKYLCSKIDIFNQQFVSPHKLIDGFFLPSSLNFFFLRFFFYYFRPTPAKPPRIPTQMQ